MTDSAISRPVELVLSTRIEQADGTNESYSLTASGEWIQKNGAHFLKYDEIQEAGTVHTVVKMGDDQAVILRSGALKMRLAFTLGEQVMSSYESEFGTFALITDTKKLHSRTPGEQAGQFQVTYTLEMACSPVGTYYMTIDYKEAPNS